MLRLFKAGSSLAWLFSESKSAFRSFILFRMILALAFDDDDDDEDEDGAMKSELGGVGLARVEFADFISPKLLLLLLFAVLAPLPNSDGVIRCGGVLLMDGRLT